MPGCLLSSFILFLSMSRWAAVIRIRSAAFSLVSLTLSIIKSIHWLFVYIPCQHHNNAKALLTDIGTEELAHMEMIAGLVYKLVDGLPPEDFIEAGWEGQWVQHDHGLFWTDANGVPWTAKYIACLGDPITDLVEDMAAEQKARSTYEHLISAIDDPLVNDTLRFLWEREVVHFQRFGEMLNHVQMHMAEKKHMWTGHDMKNDMMKGEK